MSELNVVPIAYVHSPRTEPLDDDWGEVESQIRLAEWLPESALEGLESFSHVEVLYHFHLVPEAKI
ncbi:MAG: hypothetical protein KC561_16790, partial [Myxococcales bacterium]|nr:hypothetical protein [Myxococcales bacterium]